MTEDTTSDQTPARQHTLALSIARGLPLDQEPGLGALTIPGYLREVVDCFGEREAVVFHGVRGVVRWTYRQLWHQAVTVARALVAAGTGRDCRVGLLMSNRPEFLAAIFGVALAGGVSVPLSTFSTPAELEHLIRLSGVSTLLLERHVAGRDFVAALEALEPAVVAAEPGQLYGQRLPFLRRLVVLDDTGQEPVTGAMAAWPEFLAAGDAVPVAQVDAIADSTAASDVGVIFFSSGTTGLPKGMIHSHRAVTLQWWRWPRVYALEDDVRVWTANGFFWSGLFSLVIGAAFTSGGAVVLQSTFDPDEALTLLVAERVTLPIAKRHQWARIETLPDFLAADLGSLRYVDDTKYLQVRHPSIQTSWHDPRAYGATETLTNSTAIPSSEDYDPGSRNFGPPLPGNVFKVIDPATGDVVPLGDRGEFAVKGPTLMLGYLGRTADSTFDEDGFFRTGDGGYLDEQGRVFWEGRLNDIIKTGGANVSPNEVDQAILRFPGVRLSQTLGLPDELMGEIVVSCVVPQDGVTLDDNALRAFLRERLASFKIPRRILYLDSADLKLTDSGVKVKVGELRERLMNDREKV